MQLTRLYWRSGRVRLTAGAAVVVTLLVAAVPAAGCGRQTAATPAAAQEPEAASNSGPAWSPDGRHIAFTSDRDGNNEIYVIGADGSGRTRLTRNQASDVFPAWSPDGW